MRAAVHEAKAPGSRGGSGPCGCAGKKGAPTRAGSPREGAGLDRFGDPSHNKPTGCCDDWRFERP
jgi:hypothetical protein